MCEWSQDDPNSDLRISAVLLAQDRLGCLYDLDPIIVYLCCIAVVSQKTSPTWPNSEDKQALYLGVSPLDMKNNARAWIDEKKHQQNPTPLAQPCQKVPCSITSLLYWATKRRQCYFTNQQQPDFFGFLVGALRPTLIFGVLDGIPPACCSCVSLNLATTSFAIVWKTCNKHKALMQK